MSCRMVVAASFAVFAGSLIAGCGGPIIAVPSNASTGAEFTEVSYDTVAHTLHVEVIFDNLLGTILDLLPSLDDKAPVEHLLKLVHAYGAYALIALVALHTAASLRHHFIIRDAVLRRMLPHLRRLPAVASPTKEHSS